MKRLAALIALLAIGCAPIKPYQRERLAHRCMQPNARPEEARARQHALGARESSQGGSGEAGGGCGCN